MAAEFTRIERKLWEILIDGAQHSKAELLPCLEDSAADDKNLQDYMKRMRLKIRPKGLDIVAVVKGWRRGYRLVRPITPGE